MRIIRFVEKAVAAKGRQPMFGILEGSRIYELAGGWENPSRGTELTNLADVMLLNPCDPSVIVCAGGNYHSQLAELGKPVPAEPVIFLKGRNSLAGPGDVIQHPLGLERLEYEGELAVVISRVARNVKPESFDDYVLGYTCANDVTASDWRADGQWTRAKSLDTFCPMGPWIETSVAPESLRLQTRLNSETVQDCETSDMVFGVGELLAWITQWITLQPGDVLLTASPAGVGQMKPGDSIEVEISGIGVLSNTVQWPSSGSASD
ncbi:fumarylacetoacetate hydrolase family protein [Arthrobacter sp. zg-Y820]|uniref:fumarylacetoacetate hydrolase family protein n=1 Tax=unclassified Arthrobacter TaxID=235627 RepID=UPI002540A3D8|nr:MULTISPECIES: fumarylacetoacetate hydrolase family protein [unclassified Arthrobacter]MCC9198366.1 fumarylacetoacetate hydrolase family protein [Arthrobacter sp. zg-Y820]MDK1281236.1 fumarylacetoacetate hydrolase family protein [Arthrobacter sp. zg.Y820]MDK1361456.1 fumarylacetoacetate hydrolase family protein [Arthrobacter sp. zg-Y1219]WIB09823.1 fumarylacetoacetate hydrolase family protein [Arthrobacter sp. zg-Y820]